MTVCHRYLRKGVPPQVPTGSEGYQELGAPEVEIRSNKWLHMGLEPGQKVSHQGTESSALYSKA